MADKPRGEEAALVAVQSALADRPGVLAGARALSHFGEHSIGWVAVSALGALLQPRRRTAWLVAGAGAFIAHAAAVVIKRVVQRERPHHPAVAVNVACDPKRNVALHRPPHAMPCGSLVTVPAPVPVFVPRTSAAGYTCARRACRPCGIGSDGQRADVGGRRASPQSATRTVPR